MISSQSSACLNKQDKKLMHRRGTARRIVSVEVLSTAAQLFEKILEKARNR